MCVEALVNLNIIDVLKEWQVFFATVAAATATLTGLLFVSLSINIKRFRRPENAELMRTARGAFGDFLYVLMIGIMFLVPFLAPVNAAVGFFIALLVLGGARVAGLIRVLIRTTKEKKPRHTFTSLVREFALPIFAAFGLIGVGVMILLGHYEFISFLVLVIAALLATASWKAWRLLVMEKR
jgi:hypothetical protein